MSRALFARQVSTLLSGRFFSLLLSLAIVPIVARLFDPADFGVLAIFLLLAQLFAHIAPLRYYRAALLVDEEQDARVLMAMSAIFLGIGCLLLFCALITIRWNYIEISLIEPMGALVYLLPVGMFIHGIRPILGTACTRRQTYRIAALSDVGETLLMGLSRILFGFLGGSSVWALIVSFLVGGVTRVTILAKEALIILRCILRGLSWKKIKNLADTYRDFPLNDMPAGLLTFLSGKVPILMIGLMFAPAVVGLYAMADRLIRMPVASAGTAVREVFMRKIAVDARGGAKMRRPLVMLTLGMLFLGIIPFGVLGFYGAEILSILLGEKWAGAGIYVQILAPWYYASWVSTGVHPTLVAMRRQKLWLRMQAFALIGRASVFGIGYLVSADIEMILMWFSGINVLNALLVFSIVFYLVTIREKS